MPEGMVLTEDDGVDRLTGGSDDDTLIGNGGDDVLKGGDGIDTAVFSGNLSDYAWSTTNKGYSTTGPDGTDSLEDIEVLQFDDFTYNLSGNNAPVASYPTTTLYTDVDTPIEFSVWGYDIDDPSFLFITTDFRNELIRTSYAETYVGLGRRIDATYTFDPTRLNLISLGLGETCCDPRIFLHEKLESGPTTGPDE